MSDELEAFRDDLRRAGQPWSRRGVATVAAGIVGLVISQVAPTRWMVVLIAVALASAAVIMVGWVFLVIAFVKRRRWARENPIQAPALADPGAP